VLGSTVAVRRAEGTDVIEESDSQIGERVGTMVAQLLDDREADLSQRAIDGALASQGRGAIGVDETSMALVEGRVDHLLLDHRRSVNVEDLNPLARETIREAERPEDGAEVLIELALRSSAEVTSVRGSGADLLAERGGVAALLRY
jgi:stalled ribosome rescue protein Dom34